MNQNENQNKKELFEFKVDVLYKKNGILATTFDVLLSEKVEL